MKKLTLAVILTLGISGAAYACYKTKQCCRKDHTGLQCITKCDYEYCPFNYPIELK